MAIPSIDFGSLFVYHLGYFPVLAVLSSSRFFRDQTQDISTTNGSSASTAIGHGGAWITAHVNTARL
jgi:hypothetical protein